MKIELYDYFRSSASFRVRIALNLKGLNYDVIPVHLINNGGEQHSPEYASINPSELVPTALFDGKAISQSLAIIEYLEDTYPQSRLLPSDPYHKSLVRSFALSIAADMHPLNNLRVLTYLKNDLKLNDSQKSQWYHHWMKVGLDSLENQLVKCKLSGSYCFGENPTLADICLVPQLFNARRFNCDIAAYPTLIKIDENCQKLDAFQKAWPKEPVSS